jgi:CheY-like chemotaxis protein
MKQTPAHCTPCVPEPEPACRARRHLKGIAVSGYGMEADIQKSLDAGFSVHLTKPVDMKRLEDALREICRE